MTTFGLYLMSEKGLRVLEALVPAIGADAIAYVVSARDPQVTDDFFPAIAGYCSGQGIRFHEKTRPAGCTAAFGFAVSWRWIIRDEPNLIVLHDSLLPKYRGFAPLPTALIKGESMVGVTALLATDEYDRGDIVGQRSLAVSYPVKVGAVIAALSSQYAALVLELCYRLSQGLSLERRPQDESQATYSIWRDDADYRVDWNRTAAFLKRFIDSLGPPYRGAAALLAGRTVRIFDAEVAPDVVIEERHAGKIIFLAKGTPVVICGQGLLKLTDLRDDATGNTLLPLRRLRSRFE